MERSTWLKDKMDAVENDLPTFCRRSGSVACRTARVRKDLPVIFWAYHRRAVFLQAVYLSRARKVKNGIGPYLPTRI